MLFDTDVIIWGFKGNMKASAQIDNSPERYISSVSYMELLKGARDKEDQKMTKRFIFDLGFEILSITENISHRAIIYMEEFSLKSGMDLTDALIAATATENLHELCTANSKHYKIIPDIQLKVFRPKCGVS